MDQYPMMTMRIVSNHWRSIAAMGLVILATGCSPGPMNSLDLIQPAAWDSQPLPIAESQQHFITKITIHHSGVLWKSGDDPVTKIKGLQTWGQREKTWPDVPYHFLIAPDGRIFEGRELRFAGETNTEYDPRGHALIQVWGNFEEQRVSQRQLASTVALSAWLCSQFDLSPSTIRGHRNWSDQTSCPGKDLQRYLDEGDIELWVREALAGVAPKIILKPVLPDGPHPMISATK
jgi:hypothetical protein